MNRSKQEKGIKQRISEFLNKRTPKAEQLTELKRKGAEYVARVNELEAQGMGIKESRQKAYDEVFANSRFK